MWFDHILFISLANELGYHSSFSKKFWTESTPILGALWAHYAQSTPREAVYLVELNPFFAFSETIGMVVLE